MTGTTTKKPTTHVHIRWMVRRDMPEVLAIENAGFEYPWCEEEFLRTLRQRNCIGMIAEHGERIAGFMIYELHKGRIVLVRLATHPDYRRRDVGRQMVAKLAYKLSPDRRDRLATTVRETNLAGQFFLRSCELRCVRVEREHYEDTGEDGYVFEYILT